MPVPLLEMAGAMVEMIGGTVEMAGATVKLIYLVALIRPCPKYSAIVNI